MESSNSSSLMKVSSRVSPGVKFKPAILANSLAEMGINEQDIENVQLSLKKLRKERMNSDKKMRLNAYVAEWYNVIKMLDCAYKSSLKDHKEVIMAASKKRCAPMRHMMRAIIGLLASVIVIALTQIFSEQMALLVGCVTLIFSTFEYWLRKGILETYLLDWSKKYRRISFVSSLPNTAEVSVKLLTWERKVRQEFEYNKQRIKQYQDACFIRSEMEKFLLAAEIKEGGLLSLSQTEFLEKFRLHLCAALEADMELLLNQLDHIKRGVDGIVNFDSLTKELTQKVWQLWLDEQSQDFLDQFRNHYLSKNMRTKYTSKRSYLCLLWEELESTGTFLNNESLHETPSAFLVDQFIQKIKK